MANPSRNGADGRDERGRFAPGNPGGPGNPHAKQTGKLRSAEQLDRKGIKYEVSNGSTDQIHQSSCHLNL